MRAIGTEPGDFVEFDLDLIEADRHQKIHDLLQKIIPALQDELNCQLSLAADGLELVLMDNNSIRFRATFNFKGRLILTDQRPTKLL
jgi:hypothetical protein